MTGQELIDGALRYLGVLPSGESPSSQERTDALAAVNGMLESWAAQNLPVPSLTTDDLAIASAKTKYTIGSSIQADFNVVRPLAIVSAARWVSADVRAPMEITGTVARFNEVAFDRSLTSFAQRILFYNPVFPLGELWFWPKPAYPNGGMLELVSYKPLAALTLNGTISLPAGYERALKHALAIELAPEYGVAVDQLRADLAKDSALSIFGLNAKLLGNPAGAGAAAMPQAA